MPNLLELGSAWLADRRETHLAGLVTYQRGQDSVDVPATTGQTVFRFDDPSSYGGATIRYVSRDFIVRVEHLTLDGVRVEPHRGDRVLETSNGTLYTHEVMPPGGDEPEWRYSDPQRTTYRIHTKLIEESPVEVMP